MDGSKWRNNFHAALELGEEKLITASDNRRKRRKETVFTANVTVTAYISTMQALSTQCQPRIGLFSPKRHCSAKWKNGLDP